MNDRLEENARFKEAVEQFCKEYPNAPYMSDKLLGFTAGWEAALEAARADLELERLAVGAMARTAQDVGNRLRQAEADRDRWKARAERYYKGLWAVEGLISESHGVAGLHLNGDVAPWETLRTGGTFEEWLLDFDAALAGMSTNHGHTRTLEDKP